MPTMKKNDAEEGAGGEVRKLLDRLRTVIDEREELAKQDKTLNAEKAGIEASIMAWAEKVGTDIFRCPRLTVTLKEKTRYIIDPAKWKEFYEWAVANKCTHLLYKQASSGGFDDLVKAGAGVPAMVTMEDYTKLSARRSGK